MRKMRPEYLATAAWAESVDVFVRRRKHHRSLADVTRRKNCLGLLEYAQDRETELGWAKEQGDVSPDASVAYPMLGLAPKKPNTIFYLKKGSKKAVVVLMMNVRQEIAESIGNDEPTERLKEHILGNCGLIRENFEKHGILNVITKRPRLTAKTVNGSLFEFDSKKKRDTSVNLELEKYKKELKRSRSESVSPVSASSSTPKDLCVSPASFPLSRDLSMLDADLMVSPRSASRTVCSPSAERGGSMISSSHLRRVRSFSPKGRVLEEVSTITGVLRDVRLTCCSSPVNGGDSSDEEERHVDLTTTRSSVTPDVFFPFVHYTLDEWTARGETKATYWKMCKRGIGGLEFMDERVPLVTSKQIREEDLRHVERLKSEHSWRQSVEFFGGDW